MHLQSDVCIIGNGAVGKTAALALAQAGLGVNLLCPPSPKRAAAPACWDVRVFALNEVAHALLSSVKVWDAMDQSRIAAVDSMVVRGDGRDDAGTLGFDAYGARTGALAWILEDRNLNQALDSALKFAPNVKLVQGVARTMEMAAEHAEVRLENGDTLRASLLVGADGAQSWVRGQCQIGIDYRSYGQSAIVTNFACEHPHHGVASQWFDPAEGIIALLPLPGNLVSLVWSAPEALAQRLLKESLAQLARRLMALPEYALGELTPLQPEAAGIFPLRLLRTHSIVAPRVALAGDAAHVVHPLAGHGMNLGFGDVADLVKAIAGRESFRDCGDPRVLARYARARSEDIFLMQLATDGLQRLFATDFEPLRVARNLGLNLLNKLPVIKRGLISHAMGKRL